MFGTDDQGQSQGLGQQSVVSPTNINQAGPLAPSAQVPTNAPDPSSLFPPAPQDNSDPFGTAPKPDDNSSSISPFAQDSATASDSNLVDIKLQALQQLTPLVKHLEQSPEEKFKTTMMMIQATDDKSLIPDAFASAKDISDDTVRAKALLDIVNEINYFTQSKNN